MNHEQLLARLAGMYLSIQRPYPLRVADVLVDNYDPEHPFFL